MDLYDAMLALTHVAGQLSGRWLPQPVRVNAANYLDTEAYRVLMEVGHGFSITREGWEDIILSDLSLVAPALFWMPKLIERHPHLLQQIPLALEKHFAGVQRDGGCLLFISSELYPPALRNIAKPPLMISYLGCIDCLALRSFAVIGSRQTNYHSVRECIALGEQLAEEAICVVSGGAIGCDIAVHQGMLASKVEELGACVVFAGGLGQLYPRRHERVFREIVKRGGLLLSERLWWQSSQPRDFPIRNRIVSGLCEGVVVMLAGDSSGAFITADEALEQGREVYVLRHDWQDIRAAGSFRLLEDGAIGFSNAEDLLRILALSDFEEKCDFPGVGACQLSPNIGNVMVEPRINNVQNRN